MPDPLIIVASSAATWVVKKLLDQLALPAIKALLRSKGLDDKEVWRLEDALQNAKLVLGAVPVGVRAAGIKIENVNLGEPILQVQQLAAELAKYLDELEYYDIREKVTQNIPRDSWNSFTYTVRSITHVGHSSKPAVTSSEISRVMSIVDRLNNICANVYDALKIDKLGAIIQSIRTPSTDTRETTYIRTESKKVFERGEKKKIVDLICNAASSGNELSVVPIIGDGGVGKTTLAREVYRDQEVKDNFDIMIWIYVSANFNEVKITQGILEQIPGCEYKSTNNLTVLHRGIQQHLNKRFLLVLDDVWEERESSWDRLLAPLRCTQVKGNVILLTTRSLSVADKTSKEEMYIKLDGMKKDVFWSFFKQCIFGDEKYEDKGRLQDIAKKIAIKLNGNPLAAKTVGTLLRRHVHEVHWRKILDIKEWIKPEGMGDLEPALMLSFNHLPYHLQLLFSYCAVFPKGYRFDKEQLIRMWITLGFVVDQWRNLEDAASYSFDDLVDRSFFQNDGQQFIVHDLLHDVAQQVSVHECLAIDGLNPGQKFFQSTRHVGIWTESVYKEDNMVRNQKFEEKLDKIQNSGMLTFLESLMLVGMYDENFSKKFSKILEKTHYVRLLQLSVMPFNADSLLSRIRNFIHLRYLELRSTPEMSMPLPTSICQLYHLQLLDVTHWSGLYDLPKGMSNLVNLRYLFVPGSGSLHSKISRVGELKLLQELKQFQVQKEDGFDISQLGSLNEISGSLSILGLENVTKKEEATQARIGDKMDLRTLSLTWGSVSGSCTVQREVMEGLKPHEDLASLLVFNYAGSTPSWWLRDDFSLRNLESFHLQDCAAVKILPPFEEMPYLKKLSLVGMPSLKNVRIDFNSADQMDLDLSEIEISQCSGLTSIRLHSCNALTKLSINDCEKLASLEGLPSSEQLRQFVVQGCPQLPSGSSIPT
uniref:Uncharacterized protein n=1 Tax=Oryza glumipatula TaxID=40148 RepID=A0A0E0ARR6_9ORYZ